MNPSVFLLILICVLFQCFVDGERFCIYSVIYNAKMQTDNRTGYTSSLKRIVSRLFNVVGTRWTGKQYYLLMTMKELAVYYAFAYFAWYEDNNFIALGIFVYLLSLRSTHECLTSYNTDKQDFMLHFYRLPSQMYVSTVITSPWIKVSKYTSMCELVCARSTVVHLI